MTDGDALKLEHLDPILAGIIRDNEVQVIGWMQGQPGSWGFLAGKSVAACRNDLGRTLAEGERRLVWHRLWWWLEQIKCQALDQA